jgi:hypothetical protein
VAKLKSPLPGRPSIKPATKLGPESELLFDKLAEEILHGERELFDSLTQHEQEAVKQWLSDALVDGNAENAVHDVLWEIDFVRKPVTIEKFLTNVDYLGRTCSGLNDKWMEDLCKVFAPSSPVMEWILTGAIGIGKTTVAGAGLAYKLYYLSCLRNPAQYYGLLPDSHIVFGIYSITKRQVSDAGYFKLKSYIDSSPYFKSEFPRSPRIDSKMVFTTHPVSVIPGSQELHALGLDMYSFLMDEVNFMRSKTDETGGATTGQAYDLYNSTSSRLMSRFMRPGGNVPGIMMLLSSRNAQTSFLEERLKKVGNSKTTYVSDYSLWEVKPKHRFVKPKFKVEVGDRVAHSRILRPSDKIRPGARTIDIPGEFRERFEEDVDQALRDIAGVATFNVSPLIRDRQSIFDAVKDSLVHPFKQQEITIDFQDDILIEEFFEVEKMCQVRDSRWVPIMNPGCPRFIHVDLSLSEDCAGIAMSHMSGFMRRDRLHPDGTRSLVEAPYIIVDFMLKIVPPRGSQTDISKIRAFILYLRDFFNIELVTFDGFQSADAIQVLTKSGVLTKKLSVDLTDEQYLSLRSAFFERRIATYNYPPFIDEMLDLERDVKERKVDHPARNSQGGKGSKDVADGVCGAVWNTLTSENARKVAPPLDAPIENTGRVVVPAHNGAPALVQTGSRVPKPQAAPTKRVNGLTLSMDDLRNNLKP